MSNVGVQFVLLLLLLVANGVFAAAELSIASSRKVRLQQRAEAGDAGARAALDLANEPGRGRRSTSPTSRGASSPLCRSGSR